MQQQLVNSILRPSIPSSLAQTALKPLLAEKQASEVTVCEYKSMFGRMLAHFPEEPDSARSIGVAVSGGPDSTALLWLTKKAFPGAKIRAYMIDHDMGSLGVTEYPERVSETMKRTLQTDLEVLKLDWSDTPLDSLTTGKRMLRAREKRYEALLKGCLKDEVGLLLLGHNLDDDIVTMFYRLARFSGLDGASGMRPMSSFPAVHSRASSVLLGRPLLGVEKCRLLKTCEQNSLSFTTDQSNSLTEYSRNLILSTLSDLQEQRNVLATEKLRRLLHSMKGHHRAVHEKVVEAMNESVFVNKRHGTAVIVANNHESLLNHPVWIRILSYLFQYVAARLTPSRTSSIQDAINHLNSASSRHQESLARRDKRTMQLQRIQQQYNYKPLPSDNTPRIHVGMQVMGGCVLYPLARTDAALRIEAAKRESGRSDVQYGPAFLVQRERLKTKDAVVNVELGPAEEYLWDERFFISFRTLNPAVGRLRVDISPLSSDACKTFIKQANLQGAIQAKRLLQAFQAITPSHMLYAIPIISVGSGDEPDYMAIPCINAQVGNTELGSSIQWAAVHAGEGTLVSKFKCLP